MSWANLSWIISVIGIIGAILNIQKKKICFVVWSIGNIFWMLLSIVVPEYRGQMPLWITFTILNIYGWYAWRKDELKKKLEGDDLKEEE